MPYGVSTPQTSGATLSKVDATLANDVTMTTALTFYDGPSAVCAAGTWLFVWKVTLAAPTAATQAYTGILTDGTTVYDESETDIANPGAGAETVVNGQAIVTLASQKTMKIQATSARNTTVMKREVIQGSATTHTATRLSGIKIA